MDSRSMTSSQFTQIHALKVDPHVSGTRCIQCYNTSLAGHVSYPPRQEYGWDVPQAQRITWIEF